MAAKFRIGRKLDDDEILEDNTYNTTTNIRKNGIENREDKHPNSQTELTWIDSPKVCLLIGKQNDKEVIKKLIEVSKWLFSIGIEVIVEPQVIEASQEEDKYQFSDATKEDLRNVVDFGVCIGGDGTVLHFNSFFPSFCPPVICFNYKASLGFLTKHPIENYKDEIDRLIKGPIIITLRSRIRVIHQKKSNERSFIVSTKESANQKNDDKKEFNSFTCLNEVVLDRGPSPFLAALECYYDDSLITTVQGDGIIIATSTGSTAYSLSAGGSMLHPCVPSMIFTPISPHSLSFRPVVLPSAAKLRIQTAPDSRGTAWVCYDGRRRFEVHSDDKVLIKMSRYPMPTISSSFQMSEWFSSLANGLNWNIRTIQSKL